MRHELDNYSSPWWYATYLIEQSGILIDGSVLEPCAGDGAIASILKLYPQVTNTYTNDINLDVVADYHLDIASPKSWQKLPTTDYVITNPPFNIASDVIPQAIAKARKGVACFLRASFAEPTKDRRWLKQYPVTVRIELPRFKFRQNQHGKWGTDGGTISLFFWDKTGCVRSRMETVFADEIWDWYDRPTAAPSFEAIALQIAQRRLSNPHKKIFD